MKTKRIKIFALIFFSVLLQQCCTSNEGIKEKKKLENVKIEKQLQRGIVDLTYSLKKVLEKENKNYCLVKVIKIHGYGSGVKHLAENTEYEFEIDRNLLEDIKSKVGMVVRSKIISLPSGVGQNNKYQFKIISLNK